MAEQYRQNGNELFGNGQFEEAAMLYTKSLEHSQNAVTYANRAQVHLQCGRWAPHRGRKILKQIMGIVYSNIGVTRFGAVYLATLPKIGARIEKTAIVYPKSGKTVNSTFTKIIKTIQSFSADKNLPSRPKIGVKFSPCSVVG